MEPNYNEGTFSYLNQENYMKRKPVRPIPDPGETMTVPGEAQTMREIMDRAINGMPVKQVENRYFDLEDLEVLRQNPIDLVDLDETRAALQEQLEIINEGIAKRNAEEEENDGDNDPADPTPDDSNEPNDDNQ